MDMFDRYEDLFRTLGLSEVAAKAAAVGRYRNEAEARQVYVSGEAEELAEELLDRQSRGAPILAPGQPPLRTTLAELPPCVAEAAHAAGEVLGMKPSEAKDMAIRLHAREARRAGAEHANRFVYTFAYSLRRPVSEAAYR